MKLKAREEIVNHEGMVGIRPFHAPSLVETRTAPWPLPCRRRAHVKRIDSVVVQ
jgi:hypothetical protein